MDPQDNPTRPGSPGIVYMPTFSPPLTHWSLAMTTRRIKIKDQGVDLSRPYGYVRKPAQSISDVIPILTELMAEAQTESETIGTFAILPMSNKWSTIQNQIGLIIIEQI